MATSMALEMEKELHVAAVEGNVEFLGEGKSNEYLLRKTYEKNNIIHIAIRHEQHDFIEVCLRRFTKNELICDNSKGNNPLHVAAEVGNLIIVKLLYKYMVERIESYGAEKPWRARNSRGNTPLHVALIHDNVNIARFLLEEDPSLACIVNNSKEAPLHLAIKQHVNYSESESIMARVQQPINEGGSNLTIKVVPREEMSSVIKLLIEKASSVTCWPDAKSLTPLHRVASLSTPYNLDYTKFILQHCPHSAEVCDNSGKSIIHLLVNKMSNYQEAIDLLSLKEIYALRNHQDQQGNTPMHIAAKNMDINMVRVLLESSTKLNINNIDGISAASVIQQQNVLQMLRKRKMTKEEIEATDRVNITFLRERMRNLGVDLLFSQDSKGRNILHRLMQIKKESRIMLDDFVNFIEQALEIFPSLVCQTDHKGDTPIHVLVQNHPDTTIYVASGDQRNALHNSDCNLDHLSYDYVYSSLWLSKILSSSLEQCNLCILKLQNEARDKKASFDSPWLVQNVEGNTPLHEALIAGCNNKLARLLLNYDKKSAAVVNKRKETPLHLLASHPKCIDQFSREDIKGMVDVNAEAAFLPDQNGLTPLLRAFKAGSTATAAMLCSASPKAAKIGDTDCLTYGHLLVEHPSEYYFSRLIQEKELRNLLELKDKIGNTPLHLAIEGNRFDLVQVFLKFWEENEREPSKEKIKWVVKLLETPNKAGKTPGDLVAESPSLPPNIEKSILDKNELIGVRSVWGIPTGEMKTYVNTIGIVATLLTTITFTTAFTVPGGLIGNIGTPVLIEKAAFQVFIISDIIAMCLSTMVLCCLLWIMATNNKRNSVMILDFSLSLLLLSFFATLLTFMTGLYATTSPVKPRIAIVTLVLCSLLMLLVIINKIIVIELLLPFINAMDIFIRKLRRFLAAGLSKKTKPSNPGVGAQEHTRQGSLNNV